MSDNPLVAVPAVPAPPAPAGDTLPVPTPEQQQQADALFARPEEHHNVAANLLGMVGAVQLLHDIANETLRRTENALREEELEELPVPPEDNKE